MWLVLVILTNYASVMLTAHSIYILQSCFDTDAERGKLLTFRVFVKGEGDKIRWLERSACDWMFAVFLDVGDYIPADKSTQNLIQKMTFSPFGAE